MKKLQLMALAILFAIAGTGFVEAKRSCTGRAKSDCKGSCQWRNRKCRRKKSPAKPVANPIPGTVYNMLADSMPITFYTAKDGTIVDSNLPKDNGVSMIGSNPSLDNTTVDENGYPWSVSIPSGATFVKFGPCDAAMDTSYEGFLISLVQTKAYKIESNYSDNDDLVVNLCPTSNCQ